MAATVTFDVATVTHTLDPFFSGIGSSIYNWQAYANSSYRASFADYAPELIRWNPWDTHGGTPSNPGGLPYNAYHTYFRDFCVALGFPVWLGMTGRPQSLPSTRASNDPTNYADNGTGGSPLDLAQWYEDYVQHGINVVMLASYNEPGNTVHGQVGVQNGPGNGPWFGDGDPVTDFETRQCETLCQTAIHRPYYLAHKTIAQSHGWTLPPFTLAGGDLNAQQYSLNWIPMYVEGQCIDGSAWPYGDGNQAYFDALESHPYAGIGGFGDSSRDQGAFNAVWYDPAGYVTMNDTVGFKHWARYAREYLDSKGLQSKSLVAGETAINAGGGNNENALAGIWEAQNLIFAASYAGRYKITKLISWSTEAHPDSEGTGSLRLMDSNTWTLRTRACILRDIVHYFSRTYKRQLIAGQDTVNSGSDMTPAGYSAEGRNNSVPAVVACAGLNSAGNRVGVLLANIDGTNSHTANVSWTNGNPNGTATYKEALTSFTGTGSTRVPSGTQTLSGSSFSRVLQPYSAVLIEIPVQASGGSAPVNTSLPTISGSTDQGKTLTANPGVWTGGPTFTYQWLRNATAIGGATSSTYTTTAADIGSLVSVTVTGTNGAGSSSATSGTVGPIRAPVTGNAVGVTTIGGTWHQAPAAGYANAFVGFTIPAGHSYQLGVVKAYMSGSPAAGTLRMRAAVWTDSNGEPGTVAATWGSVTITGGATPTVASWKEWATTNVPVLTAGDYWLGLVADPAGASCAQIAVESGGLAYFGVNGSYTTLAVGDPWTDSNGGTDQLTFSIYAEFIEPLSGRRRVLGGRTYNPAGRTHNPAGRVKDGGGGL